MGPKTKIGKLSVLLQTVFILTTIISVGLVWAKVLRFDDTWWDVTAGIIFPTTIVATVLGVIARRKKDDSKLVLASVIVGVLVLIFIFTHSLFIAD